jgi:hypothetical protein
VIVEISLHLSSTLRIWKLRYKNRRARLKRLREMHAPQIIIENEERLCRQALAQIYAWILLPVSAWEIDIVSGEMTITDTTDGGKLLIALLLLDEDDSPETEEL